MIIESTIIEGAGLKVPSIRIMPRNHVGSAIVVHGYGGCKEEQLGLAWRIALSGLVTYAIDLRGHGQHPQSLDDNLSADIELTIQTAREFGKVVAIGHSLGGRLSLMSSADFAIGISPPLDSFYGARTEELLYKLRSYRVRTDSPRKVFDLLASIPDWVDKEPHNSMIVYGSRDVPEIVASCDRLRSTKSNVLRIENALHSDTYLLEKAFESIADQLGEWFQNPKRI